MAPARLGLLLLACLLGMGASQDAPPADQLALFFEETRSLSALFRQEVFSADGERLSTGHGDMNLLWPNYLRWNYQAPEPLLLASDGSNFWSYDPVLEQATVTPLEDAVRDTPLAILLDAEALDDLFEVDYVHRQGGIDWTLLRSRPGAAHPTELLVGLRSGALERLHFVDQFGQKVRIRFEQVRVNPPLEPESFYYHPPHGTDIFGTPAS